MDPVAFPIEDVMTLLTGKIIGPRGAGGAFDIVFWMVHETIPEDVLPTVAAHCSHYIRRQYPDVAGAAKLARLDRDSVEQWLAKCRQRFGERLILYPFSPQAAVNLLLEVGVPGLAEELQAQGG